MGGCDPLKEVKTFVSYFTVCGVRFDGEKHDNNAGDGAIYEYKREVLVIEPVEILDVKRAMPMIGWLVDQPVFALESRIANQLKDLHTCADDYKLVARACGHDGVPRIQRLTMQAATGDDAPADLSCTEVRTQKQTVCGGNLPSLAPAQTV
jgi:hypothetical protein